MACRIAIKRRMHDAKIECPATMLNRLSFAIIIVVAGILLAQCSDPAEADNGSPNQNEEQVPAASSIIVPAILWTKQLLANVWKSPSLPGPIHHLHFSQQPVNQPQKEHRGTRLQRLVQGLNQSIVELTTNSTATSDSIAPPPPAKLEEWSVLIFESMSAASRDFHSVEHVFDISQGANAIQTIGAYFHDVVYYSIDKGLSELQANRLQDIIVENPDGRSVRLKDGGFDSDPTIGMVVNVFGFEAGQQLHPFKGLNEFLSASLAVRCLEDSLQMEYLIQIAACIEATVPFRGVNDEGRTVGQELYKKLKTTRDKYPNELGRLTDDDLIQTTKSAVDLANRDVANFAGKPGHFLSKTWSLLPETNIAFRKTNVYRISSFTFALKKMAGFFGFLDPGAVFNQFHDMPTDEAYAKLISQTRSNMDIAKKYMNAKLLSISVIGALAEQTGGDGPLSMWVGDPQGQYNSPRIEDGIDPVPDPKPDVVLDSTVFRILRDGRDDATSFDIRNSPLAAFLYSYIGDIGVKHSIQFTVYPMDQKNAELLLESLPKAVVRRIALACAQVAVTRKEGLERIAELYSDDNSRKEP